ARVLVLCWGEWWRSWGVGCSGGRVVKSRGEGAGKVGGKNREEVDQQYVLFLVWSSGFTNPQNYDGDAAFDDKEHDFDAKKPESEVILSPSSKLEDITYSDDENVVYKNKKDERGIVVRNKARFVAQGHTQEEGINYE
nr:putative LRR receptor-like protein kinase [Tanacetum cinerariifolium]